MKIVCLTLTDRTYGKGAPHHDRAHAHFAERGLGDVGWFYGIHADRIGVNTTLMFHTDYNMGPMPTGCWLSHRAAWAACLLMDDEEFLILEDDAQFSEDWKVRYESARAVLPDDWDVLFLGSCTTTGRSQHVSGEVYEVRWPMCLQAYLVRRRALERMITTQDEARCYGPIDITLERHTWPHLRVYTVLPRIVDQFDTELPP